MSAQGHLVDFFLSIFCFQELSTIGPSYERFRALTSQLKTSVSKRSAHSTLGSDVPLQRVGDGPSLITGDSLENSLGLGKSLRKGSSTGAGGQTGQGREGGGSGGNVRSTRRATAAAVAAGGSGIFGASEKDDAKTKLTQFGFPVDHPLNTENYRLVWIYFMFSNSLMKSVCLLLLVTKWIRLFHDKHVFIARMLNRFPYTLQQKIRF